MITEIGSRLKITDPSPELVAWCKKNLEMPNPEYQKKARMNLWLGNTPRTLILYEIEGNAIILPFGCLRAILPLLEGEVMKYFPEKRNVKYGGSVPLYDYQEEAVGAMLINHYGILQSPAGSGKTQMGIALASDLGVRTLWLTHTKDLLTQSKNRAEQYFSPDLMGTITEGKVNIGAAMTFATIQTMCKLDLEQYRDTWDCIIVDECHRVSGTPTAVTQFSRVLNALRARHKYGLSATVHRADGLIKATYAMLGEVVYTVPDEAVKSKIMTVHVQPKGTGVKLSSDFLNSDGTINYPKMITFLMHKNEDAWEKLLDITEFPDLGGEPELLETTTLSHRMQTYVKGVQSNEGLNFNANYDLTEYKALKALEGKDEEYAVWFGGTETASLPTPTGSEGKFSFRGDLSVFVTGGGVNEVRGMTITIAPSTVISEVTDDV